MTLTAMRDEHEPQNIKVRTTYGPVTNEVTEHESHAASFWGQLGRLLAENPEHVEAQARYGYERYRAHADGQSVHGETLPSWEELGAREGGRTVQSHWIAAFGG
jgi:hypothetical protein